MISATLGRPPAADLAATGFGAGAFADTTASGSAAAGSAAGGGDSAEPAFWARAAARISATDIFLFSAIEIAVRNGRKTKFSTAFLEFVIFFTNSL
jgi:hypothetical protein